MVIQVKSHEHLPKMVRDVYRKALCPKSGVWLSVAEKGSLAHKIAYFGYAARQRDFAALARLLQDPEVTCFQRKSVTSCFEREPLYLALSRGIGLACIKNHSDVVAFLLASKPYQALIHTKQPKSRVFRKNALLDREHRRYNEERVRAGQYVAAAKQIRYQAMELCCTIGNPACLSVLCKTGRCLDGPVFPLIRTAQTHGHQDCLEVLFQI